MVNTWGGGRSTQTQHQETGSTLNVPDPPVLGVPHPHPQPSWFMCIVPFTLTLSSSPEHWTSTPNPSPPGDPKASGQQRTFPESFVSRSKS